MKRTPRLDLTGLEYGRLSVVEVSHRDERGAVYWLCRCSCGTEKRVRANVLTSGRARSCGCLHREIVTHHGMTKTRTFKSWESMWQRCGNPKAKSYEHYGGRGIRVCERWQSFQSFHEDMGERPEGMSLDRLNVDGDYEPGNCRWADKYQQQRNRVGTRTLALGDEVLTYPEWSERTGLPTNVIRWRVSRGWSVLETLSTPLTPGRGKPRNKD